LRPIARARRNPPSSSCASTTTTRAAQSKGRCPRQWGYCRTAVRQVMQGTLWYSRGVCSPSSHVHCGATAPATAQATTRHSDTASGVATRTGLCALVVDARYACGSAAAHVLGDRALEHRWAIGLLPLVPVAAVLESYLPASQSTATVQQWSERLFDGFANNT
jgi:hypothetical protein